MNAKQQLEFARRLGRKGKTFRPRRDAITIITELWFILMFLSFLCWVAYTVGRPVQPHHKNNNEYTLK